MSVALSKMNKKELYEECKRLQQDNMRLQLFQDDNLIKENKNLQEIIKSNHLYQGFCEETATDFKKEIEELNEKVLERDTHIDILDKEVEELKNNVSDFEDEIEELKEDRDELFIEHLNEHIKDACVGSHAEFDFDGAYHLDGIQIHYDGLKEEIEEMKMEVKKLNNKINQINYIINDRP